MANNKATLGREAPHRSSLAAIFHAPGQPQELRNLPLPRQLGSGEALVRVTCCTICGSDISTITGHREEPVPCILGHEIVGIITDLGGQLRDLRGKQISVGDRVTWSVAASCSQCRLCLRGLPQKCLHLKKYGHHRLSDDWQLSGGLAEFCHLMPGSQLVVLDDSLKDELVCPVNCATATVAAACRAAGDFLGLRVLVFGAGLLGLTACAMAKYHGAECVCISDVVQERLKLALNFGADETCLSEELPSLLATRKFDIILEMSGANQAVASAFPAAAIGATIVLVGSVRPSPAVEVYPEHFVRNLLSMRGIHNYAPHDLVAAVDFLSECSASYPFEQIVSRQFPLQEINQAVAFAEQNRPIRIAIKP